MKKKSHQVPISSSHDQIVSQARRLFLSSGFRSVSMDELAADLGMSKKTLYQHFRSKDELVRAVLETKFDHVERDLEQVLATPDVPMPEQLKRLLTTLQGHVHEIQPAFVRDVQRSDPSLFAHIDERRQAIIRKYFGALLEKGRREGAVRRDVPVAILMEILLASARSIVTPERLAQLDLTPQKAFHHVLGVFLNGILTDKES
jgi:AcrR family transcriptional regulator